MFDGFGMYVNVYNFVNGFVWGFDGWLYGMYGWMNWLLIGVLGCDDVDCVCFDGGVYCYYLICKEWEFFVDGMINFWGIDWNDYGEVFICNCVNLYLFYVI